MKRLVADTGPLVHLHEAGGLHLLPLIGEIFVSPLVLTEAKRSGATAWLGPLPDWLPVSP